MATKAELLEQAQALGIETVDENSTVAEIKAAIGAQNSGTGNPPEATQPRTEVWTCKISADGKKVEKLKQAHPVKGVLISDEQAAALNEGRIHGGNSYAELYFAPGADQPISVE